MTYLLCSHVDLDVCIDKCFLFFSLWLVSSELIFKYGIFQLVSPFEFFLMIALSTRRRNCTKNCIGEEIHTNSCKGGEICVHACIWLWHVFRLSLWASCVSFALVEYWEFYKTFCVLLLLCKIISFIRIMRFCMSILQLCRLCWAFTSSWGAGFWFKLLICTWLMLSPFCLFSWGIMYFVSVASSRCPCLWDWDFSFWVILCLPFHLVGSLGWDSFLFFFI